jgi:hypothetical protein
MAVDTCPPTTGVTGCNRIYPQPMTKTTAGAKLRADLDAALARAAEEVGHALEFDEAERQSSTRPSTPPTGPRRCTRCTAPSWPATNHARPLW